MTDEELAEIKARYEAEPWWEHANNPKMGLYGVAVFITSARKEVPLLVAEIERLHERLRQTIADRETFIHHTTLASHERAINAERENAALREIARFAARLQPIVEDEMYDEARCLGCGASFGVLSLKEGDWDRLVAELEHGTDCPVARARVLLAGEEKQP